MLLTSRPPRPPLAHFDRVKLTPSYDPNPSIRSRPPANAVSLHPPPPDADLPIPPAPAPTPTRATSSSDLNRPNRPSPLRRGTDVPEKPPQEHQRRLTIANLGTPGGKMVGFPRTRQQDLSARKKVRFRVAEITIPPLPTLPTSPSTPTKNSPTEARKPSESSDIPDRTGLAPSSIVSDENRSLASSDHTRNSPVFDHETSAAGEFPESPSVYSPTPPNSSTPPASRFSDSSRGPPTLADVNLAVIEIGHLHPSIEEFLGKGSPDEQPTGEKPRSGDGFTPASKDVSRGKSHRLERWLACVCDQRP